MAKRYYNLEKETKEYLKACEERGITPSLPIETVNNFCIVQKTFNWLITPTQLIEYSFLPNIWLDISMPASYPTISRNWINLTNRSFNATLPTTVEYRSVYDGSVFLNNSQAGSVAWNNNGISNSFTIDCWVTIFEGVGVNTSAFLTNDAYQTRGFRSGINHVNRRYNFWNSESVPPGTVGAFNISTPNNSINYGIPTNITLSFNTSTSAASIFLNSSVSVSVENRTFIPPINSSLVFNANLNSTNQPVLLHTLKVYNKALTPTEINTTYNLLKGRFGL